MVQILVGRGDEFALFLEVEGGVGGLHVAGGVGFDFDEAEDVSFPADEVRFLRRGGALISLSSLGLRTGGNARALHQCLESGGYF